MSCNQKIILLLFLLFAFMLVCLYALMLSAFSVFCFLLLLFFFLFSLFSFSFSFIRCSHRMLSHMSHQKISQPNFFSPGNFFILESCIYFTRHSMATHFFTSKNSIFSTALFSSSQIIIFTRPRPTSKTKIDHFWHEKYDYHDRNINHANNFFYFNIIDVNFPTSRARETV